MLGELSLALTQVQQFHQWKSAGMESRAWILIHLNVAKEQAQMWCLANVAQFWL